MTGRPGPLAGVKAIACSTAQAGTVPYMLMADLGAEVIKIEVPGTGDGSRAAGEIKGGVSSFFETNNRGVKSLTLNLKSDEGRAILHKLVAEADVFGQNFRPGVAEKNGFDYETLKAINPALVYVSISGYGQAGPHAHLPGTDAVGQALGGVTEAYAGPGESMRTGIVSVADESCALLAFGGLLAALHCARTTGVGQKVETSLVAGVVRLMGWTLTTTMWRNRNPITGTRINGTRERPGIAASFNDIDGRPLVFQLGHRDWKRAMDALGFYAVLEERGAEDLGLAIVSEEKKDLILSTLAELFADRQPGPLGGAAARRRHRVRADQHAARSLERPGCAGERLYRREALSGDRQDAEGPRHALAVLGNPRADRRRAETRRAQCRNSRPPGLRRGRARRPARTQGHLRLSPSR